LNELREEGKAVREPRSWVQKSMKGLPLVLMSVLTFTIITYINAQGNSPTRVQFEEFLEGSVAPGTIRNYGEWTAYNSEVITGSGDGDLVGSPIAFTIVSNRRFNAYAQISFIHGYWTFVSSDGSLISGHFEGNGTTITEFSGKFVATQSQKSTKTYSKAKISGEFTCRFIPLPPYGASWRYEAWWNGTLREGES